MGHVWIFQPDNNPNTNLENNTKMGHWAQNQGSAMAIPVLWPEPCRKWVRWTEEKKHHHGAVNLKDLEWFWMKEWSLISCHGSWALGPSSLCCVCVCVQVSVFGCVWLRLISSSWGSLTGAILDPVTLSCVVRSSDCLPVSWSVVFVRSCFLLPWFLISAVSWTLNTGHLAAHCFPELPAPTYGELNLVSSVSPVWRVCNKPFLFPQLESSSLYSWQKDLTTWWIQRRLVVFRNC